MMVGESWESAVEGAVEGVDEDADGDGGCLEVEKSLE